MKNNSTFDTITKESQILFLVFIMGLAGLGIWTIQSDISFSSPYSSDLIKYPDSSPLGVAMCGASNEAQANIQPVQSGRWSDASTWPGGNLPSANDDVTIPANINVTLVGTCRARNINIRGELKAINNTAINAWIDLRAQSIMVENGGTLEIGTEANPYIANRGPGGMRCEITLTGAKNLSAPDRYKGIMVMGGGTLELHGKRKMSWTNLATTANAGTNKITLVNPVDWEVGDNIALTSTTLVTEHGREWANVDESKIISLSADRRTITLEKNLIHKHIGGSKTYTRARDGKTWNAEIRGEVGLLSHYIRIKGETNNSDGFGGHIMIMKDATSHSENIELFNMGQRGIKKRYPYHWHLNENRSIGSYLKNSSVHKSFNRAVVIHGTDSVIVDGVFAYDHIGHGIFLEDGGERYNTIKNNVVFVTRDPNDGDAVTPSDSHNPRGPQNQAPACYWITNANNYFENNVAAGTEGTGFWLATPKGKPLFASGNLAYFNGIDPQSEPLGKFDGFVAHGCKNGWDIFDGLNPDHSIAINTGWKINTNQYFRNGIFYGNYTAIYSGIPGGAGQSAKYVVFENCVITDNKIVTMLASDITLENCLISADAGLGLNPEQNRSFFRFYDGPGRHINCHFETWNQSNAEMIRPGINGGATENFNPTYSGITKGFTEPFRFRFTQFGNVKEATGKRVAQFFKDYDGGLTGKANTTIIRDIPFLRDGNEYRHPSWVNAARVDYFFASLWLNEVNGTGTNISVVRSKPGTPDACLYNTGDNKISPTYKFPLIVNKGFLYSFYFDRAPNKRKINMIWSRGDNGDLGLACFKNFGKLGNFRVSGASRLNSRAQVEAATNTSYFIESTGDVYVMFRSKQGAERIAVNFNWDNNGSFNPLPFPCNNTDVTPGTTVSVENDTDGDGRSDDLENAVCGMVNNASDLNFGFKNSNEGFTKFNIATDNTASDEFWLVRADNSNDPYIVRNNLKFKGSEVPQVKIRTKSEATGAFQLFWATSAQNNFSPDRVVTVFPNETNVFEELIFDMSGVNNWTGQTITQLRLDFPADANGVVHNWVDYIHGPEASNTGCGSLVEISFSQPSVTQLEEGSDLGVDVTVDKGSVANIKLYLNDEFLRQENGAPYQWGTEHPTAGIDPKLMNLEPGSYIIKAVATDNNDNEIIETKNITVVSRISIPGEFEAEDFISMTGEEIKIEETPGTTDGKNLGFTKNGDVIEYLVNVTSSDDYIIQTMASSMGGGGTISFYSDDILMGSVKIPVNGAWHNYEVYSAPVSMTAGMHTLKMMYTGAEGVNLFNVDKFNVVSSSVVSVEQTNELELLQVYPNPSVDGVFHFNKVYDYQVFDLKGNKIIGEEGDVVDLRNKTKGVYILQINNEQIKLIR